MLHAKEDENLLREGNSHTKMHVFVKKFIFSLLKYIEAILGNFVKYFAICTCIIDEYLYFVVQGACKYINPHI